jgi:hypothetical protein
MEPEEDDLPEGEYEVKCQKCRFRIIATEPWKFCPLCRAELEAVANVLEG